MFYSIHKISTLLPGWFYSQSCACSFTANCTWNFLFILTSSPLPHVFFYFLFVLHRTACISFMHSPVIELSLDQSLLWVMFLFQLVWGNPSRVIAPGMEAWDWPIFEHRGVMLDTTRDFYKVEDMLRTIGAMSANKLNVFPWHITCSHSFPLLLPSDPNLTEKGGFLWMWHAILTWRCQSDCSIWFGTWGSCSPEIDMPG